MIKPFRQDYPLTQKFGENPQTYAQFGLKGHNGLDYGLPNGTDVVAPHSGKIIEVAYDPTGYGTYIKIENNKEGSVLAHLKESHVSIGDTVSEGQLIAKSDNTGFSTGAHLHWGYYKIPRDRTNGYLGYIDQLPLLVPTPPPIDYKRLYEELKPKYDEKVKLESFLRGEIEKKDKEIISYKKRLADINVLCQLT